MWRDTSHLLSKDSEVKEEYAGMLELYADNIQQLNAPVKKNNPAATICICDWDKPPTTTVNLTTS